MTATTSRIVGLSCDYPDCDETIEATIGLRTGDARAEAAEQGWRSNWGPYGADLCPRHAETLP